jgi:hypothetical protein
MPLCRKRVLSVVRFGAEVLFLRIVQPSREALPRFRCHIYFTADLPRLNTSSVREAVF